MNIQFKTRHQSGSTLIEVLITMILSSVAVLGFSLLQIKAQQEHRVAYYRTVAMRLGENLLDSSRNNYRLARDGGTAFTFMPTDSPPSAPSTDCGVNSCTPTRLDAYDRYSVLTVLRKELPESGIALVWIDDPDPSQSVALGIPGNYSNIPKHPILQVTVIWREPNSDATVTDPNCARNAQFASLLGYRCTYLSTTL